jgi:hypothetical protein
LQSANDQKREEKLTKEYLQKVDFIATVQTTDILAYSNLIEAKAIKVYKGEIDRVVHLNNELSDFVFESNTEYLVYAQKTTKVQEIYIEKNSRTRLLNNAKEDLDYLNKNVSCIDKSLMSDGACERIYYPICGCDGNTYGSSCEAHKHGVAVYTIGVLQKGNDECPAKK